MESTSELVRHEPCPKCGSRDNLARYSDGHGFCFGCGHYEHGDGEPSTTPLRNRATMANKSLIEPGVARPIPKRGLSLETCERWGYNIGKLTNGEPVHIANYRRPETGEIIAQKTRTADKDFLFLGNFKESGLYGEHLWKGGGKRIVIAEGEIDAVSISQVQAHKWPVVSLQNGADGARKSLARSIDFLAGYEEIVLCFDNDEPGIKAVEDCVSLFKPGTVKVCKLPLKDANAMLLAGRVEELVKALWEAAPYRPDGIVRVRDVRSKVMQQPKMDLKWCIQDLQDATYGRRFGEAVALGAGTGIGKTTLLTQQIAEDLKDGHAVGVFAFEQAPEETTKRVAGQLVGKTFHIPDGSWTEDELESALDTLDSGSPLFLYDHFGACDWDVVKRHIRFLAHTEGVRVFYLDHLTALAAAADDERRALEQIMAEIGSLVKELNIWLLFVSHLTTPEGKTHEEGGRVKIRDFKGSRSIGFWSHVMIGLERDQQNEDATEARITVLRVLKERYTGRATGNTYKLDYDRSTGLFVPFNEESMFGPSGGDRCGDTNEMPF